MGSDTAIIGWTMLLYGFVMGVAWRRAFNVLREFFRPNGDPNG